MIKYLVIGSSGTLGSEFIRYFSHRTNFPHDANHASTTIAQGIDRAELDITNFDFTSQYILNHPAKFIINCTGYTNVDQAEQDLNTAMLINSDAVQNIAKACHDSGKTLIHFSTGMVFDGQKEFGNSETDLTNPVNAYGQSKLAGEKAIQEVLAQHIIIRTTWLYGEPTSHTAKKSFIELMLTLGKSGKIQAVTDEIGQPTWARDLVHSTATLLSAQPLQYGIFHLTNSGNASRKDWAEEIFKLRNLTVKVEPVSGNIFTRLAKRSHFEILNNTRLPQMRPWQEALAEYLTTNQKI